jgi:hypothetical protein
VVQAALGALAAEALVEPSLGLTAYRTGLLSALFYKAILAVLPPASLPPAVASAATTFERPVTTASQTYGEDPAEAPLDTPIPKLEALRQTTGSCVYTNDTKVKHHGFS